MCKKSAALVSGFSSSHGEAFGDTDPAMAILYNYWGHMKIAVRQGTVKTFPFTFITSTRSGPAVFQHRRSASLLPLSSSQIVSPLHSKIVAMAAVAPTVRYSQPAHTAKFQTSITTGSLTLLH